MILEYHPYALVFPLMEGDAFTTLVEDIKENGLRESIMLFEGKILDGRNRYRALLELDHLFSPVTAPKMFVQFDGDDAFDWVISKNLHRRHLSESQRAMIAAQMMESALKKNGHTPGISLRSAAAMLNVSVRTTSRARELMKREPFAVDLVKKGKRRIGEEPNRKTISVVLTNEEHKRCCDEAEKVRLPLCTWMRNVLLFELRKTYVSETTAVRVTSFNKQGDQP